MLRRCDRSSLCSLILARSGLADDLVPRLEGLFCSGVSDKGGSVGRMAGKGFETDIGGSDARRFKVSSENSLDTLENVGSGKEAEAVTKDECGREDTEVGDLWAYFGGGVGGVAIQVGVGIVIFTCAADSLCANFTSLSSSVSEFRLKVTLVVMLAAGVLNGDAMMGVRGTNRRANCGDCRVEQDSAVQEISRIEAASSEKDIRCSIGKLSSEVKIVPCAVRRSSKEVGDEGVRGRGRRELVRVRDEGARCATGEPFSIR